MLEHKKIQSLGDYFVDLNSRQNKGVYFYRINGYSEEISEFIKKYYDNLEQVDYDFIDDTFEEAVKLTSKVVGHVGARGHLYDKLLNKKLEREEQAEELEL